MVPVAFDEENVILHPPPSMGVEECETISAWCGVLEGGVPVTISCWKLTAEEMEEIKRTGRVWLMVLGVTMQPSVLMGTSPFENRVT